MLTRACPECGHGSAYWIQETSLYVRVDYFRCLECSHVWYTPKNDPKAVPTVVMQGRAKRSAQVSARRSS
jgi:predicted Zn finger-like uncharacterized protein